MTRLGAALDFPVPLGVPRFPRGWSPTSPDVDVYPVGLLHDLRLVVGYALAGAGFSRWPGAPSNSKRLRAADRAGVRRALRLRLRGTWTTFLRSWPNRSYWNGYLAEPIGLPHDAWTRCGHGWTRRRALRDLRRHVAQVAAERFAEL